MMTREDIRTELGWSDELIRSLLQIPDSPNARRCKDTGEYTYGLYYRDRCWPSLNRRGVGPPKGAEVALPTHSGTNHDIDAFQCVWVCEADPITAVSYLLPSFFSILK